MSRQQLLLFILLLCILASSILNGVLLAVAASETSQQNRISICIWSIDTSKTENYQLAVYKCVHGE